MTAAKRARAQSLSAVGCFDRSFTATWDYSPNDVVAALTLPVLDNLIGKFWSCTEESERLAVLEAIRQVVAFDNEGGCF